MKKLLTGILVLIMVFSFTVPTMATGAIPTDTFPIVEVQAQDQIAIEQLYATGLDIIGVNGDTVTIMVGDFEREYFEANDIDYTVIEEDATADVEWLGYQKTNSGISAFSDPITGIPGQSGTGNPALTIDPDAMFDSTDVEFDAKYGFPLRLGYRTVTEYYGEMNYLAQAYPELVKLHEIGESIEGVPIFALEICNVPGVSDGRPEALNQAGNHSREWPSNELSMNTAWYLITQYGKNEEVTDLLNSTKLWFIPMSNPDGVHYDQKTNPGTWRKNRRINDPGQTSGTYIGVDLNRNWSYRWGSNTGASSSINSDTYRGAAPNSEPEIQAITNIYKSNQIISSISGHTSGQLIIYAWAYVRNEDNADPLLAQLAREQTDFNMHADQNGNVMYAQSGEINDYLWGAVRALGYTYEYGTSFVPVYMGYNRYKAIAPYNDSYGNQRRIPLTYPTATQVAAAGVPAADLTAPVVFMTDPFVIGYGHSDRFATVAQVQAIGDLTGKILMTHQASSNANNAAVVKAAQDAGAVAVIFCGNTATGVNGGGYGHYTPNLGTTGDALLINIPVAGTSKPYCREFNEYVLDGGTNQLTLTSYTENTDSLYSQFERQIGAYMLNMSFAKTYASHIEGQILTSPDQDAQIVPDAALDLSIEIESIILNTDGTQKEPGTFTEIQQAHYDVIDGTYDWSVLPSKQPEFADKGYDITASANGRYSQTQNVSVLTYQETVDNVNFVLPDAITTTFDFDEAWDFSRDITVPFTTYTLDTLGQSSDKGEVSETVSATVNGESVTVTSLGDGEYTATFNAEDLGIDFDDDVELVINFEGGLPHSAYTNTIQLAPAQVVEVESIKISGNTLIALNKGETLQLAVKINPTDATDTSITWKSSNASLANVDENGVVTGIKAGMVQITATSANGKTSRITVQVL